MGAIPWVVMSEVLASLSLLSSFNGTKPLAEEMQIN